MIIDTARGLGAPLLLGIDRWHWRAVGPMEHFNSALFVSADGRPLGHYDKMHPVVFGEYVPLADRFPLLARLTPIHAGLTVGAGPISEKVAGLRFSPNICYETAVPHLLRRQIVELADRGEEPDVLVNLTNDGWFWGSSELDMHLACGVFRAVECRKPLLIAANTGFPRLHRRRRPDRAGKARGAKMADKEPIVVDAQADGRPAASMRNIDWPARGLSGSLLRIAGGGDLGPPPVEEASRMRRLAILATDLESAGGSGGVRRRLANLLRWRSGLCRTRRMPCSLHDMQTEAGAPAHCWTKLAAAPQVPPEGNCFLQPPKFAQLLEFKPAPLTPVGQPDYTNVVIRRAICNGDRDFSTFRPFACRH